MSTHIPGRPVSATTYQRYGCRCDGCTAANTRACQLVRIRRAEYDRAHGLYMQEPMK